MPVVDRSVDALHELVARIPQARTVREALTLAHEKYCLQAGLQRSHAEVDALTRGWSFLPPAHGSPDPAAPLV